MKIIFPEQLDNLSNEHAQRLKELGEVTFYYDIPKDEKELIQRLQGAQIIGLKWVNLTEKVINALPELKYFITLSAGYGHLPFKTMHEHNIIGINCPTHNSLAVAEYTVALLFALSKKIVEAQTVLRSGLWKETLYDFQGIELFGKTICIIGNGNIGKQVAEKTRALGMQVYTVTSKTSPEELDSLLHTSDVVSLNLPYTEKTHHLLNKTRLQKMKKGAMLINTSRGAIVDQTALLELLQSGHLGGAALDVFENEPVFTRTLPEEIKQLASLPQVIATPHAAFNTKEAAWKLGEEIIANVKAIIAGKPINIVT